MDPAIPAIGPLARKEKVLRQEVEVWDDPICCCEAEPRWLVLRDRSEDPASPTEWEVLQRPPSEEF